MKLIFSALLFFFPLTIQVSNAFAQWSVTKVTGQSGKNHYVATSELADVYVAFPGDCDGGICLQSLTNPPTTSKLSIRDDNCLEFMRLSWDGSVPDFHPDARDAEISEQFPYPTYEIKAKLESVDEELSLLAMHDPPNLPITAILDPSSRGLLTTLLALSQAEYIDFYIPIYTNNTVFIRHKLENIYETIKTVCNHIP
ncbi:MAG: hypothetical protein OXF67_10735 [Cyanobacteria bacterium MAG CAR4_bin_6]|nr:hypothetical protein [Cyanobacteria bacterium MAG CAR4_bin_6]